MWEMQEGGRGLGRIQHVFVDCGFGARARPSGQQQFSGPALRTPMIPQSVVWFSRYFRGVNIAADWLLLVHDGRPTALDSMGPLEFSLLCCLFYIFTNSSL